MEFRDANSPYRVVDVKCCQIKMKIDRWIMAVLYSIHTQRTHFTSYSHISYLSLLRTLFFPQITCTTYRYRVHARPQSSASDRWSNISAARRMQWIGQAIVTRSGEALTCRSVSMNDDIFCLSFCLVCYKYLHPIHTTV